MRYYARVHASRRGQAADDAAALVTSGCVGGGVAFAHLPRLEPSGLPVREGSRIPSQVGAAAADRVETGYRATADPRIAAVGVGEAGRGGSLGVGLGSAAGAR